jgi:hypothetical protein
VHSVMITNRIGYVMVNVFSPSDVDHGFEPLSGEARCSLCTKPTRLVGSL